MATASLSANAGLFNPPNLQIAWVELDLPLFSPAITSLASLTASASVTTVAKVAVPAQLNSATSVLTSLVAGTAAVSLSAQAGLIPGVRAYATLVAQGSISTGNYFGTVLADDPSGFWRLSEAVGTVAVDYGTHGNTGTYSGGVTLGRPGAFTVDTHTSVLFDGATSDVAVPIPVTTAYSMEAWVKASGAWLGGNRMVLTTFTGGDQLSVGLGPAIGGLGFTINLVVIGQESTIGDALNTNQWHHIVGTYDGQLAVVYHNGIEVGGNQFVGGEYGTSGTGHIGNSVGLAAFFLGSIQDVAFYSTRLSAARIATHYQSGILPRGTAGVSAGATLSATAQSVTGATIKQSAVLVATATGNESIRVATSTTVTSVGVVTETILVKGIAALSSLASTSQITAIKTTASFVSVATITTVTAVKSVAALNGLVVLTIGLTNVVSATATLTASAVIVTITKISVAQSNQAAAIALSATAVAATSQLSANVVGSFVDQSITLSPGLDFQSAAPLVITMTGVNTAWTNDTNWTLTETGASLSDSSIVVNSPTSATWTITTGPGVGNINISDGIVSANLPVIAGETITLSPSSDIVNGPLVITLTGAGTAWTSSTSWVITPNGASLDASGIVVNSSSSATWTIMTGPGVGTINISDGIASADLQVTAGAAQLLSAIGTFTSAQGIGVAESIPANATLAIQVSFAKSASLTTIAALATIDGPSANVGLTAQEALNANDVIGTSASQQASASITLVVAVGAKTTCAATATLTNVVAVSAACVCTASASLTVAVVVGGSLAASATATFTTAQGIKVAVTLAAIVVMTANPSGTVNGNATLAAVVALTMVVALGANATFAANAQSVAGASVGTQASLSGQESLVETVGPNIVAMTANAAMVNAAGVGAGATNSASAVLTSAQVAAEQAACSAVAIIVTTQTLSFLRSASLSASAAFVMTSLLTTVEDVRPIAFTILAVVGKPVARCAMSARATTQSISGPPQFGSAILSAKGVLQGTPLSVTASAARLISSTTLMVALPSLWIGRLGVSRNRPDYHRARAVR